MSESQEHFTLSSVKNKQKNQTSNDVSQSNNLMMILPCKKRKTDNTVAQRMRLYRQRKREQAVKKCSKALTSTERSRLFRLRKKQSKQYPSSADIMFENTELNINTSINVDATVMGQQEYILNGYIYDGGDWIHQTKQVQNMSDDNLQAHGTNNCVVTRCMLCSERFSTLEAFASHAGREHHESCATGTANLTREPTYINYFDLVPTTRLEINEVQVKVEKDDPTTSEPSNVVNVSSENVNGVVKSEEDSQIKIERMDDDYENYNGDSVNDDLFKAEIDLQIKKERVNEEAQENVEEHRRKYNAERSKRYRARLKLKKQSAIYFSISPEQDSSRSSHGNTEGVSHRDLANCEESNSQLQSKVIQPSLDNQALQLLPTTKLELNGVRVKVEKEDLSTSEPSRVVDMSSRNVTDVIIKPEVDLLIKTERIDAEYENYNGDNINEGLIELEDDLQVKREIVDCEVDIVNNINDVIIESKDELHKRTDDDKEFDLNNVVNEKTTIKKPVKSNAQRQKEYRMRKRNEKQLLTPKNKPRTNAENQKTFREKQKMVEQSETVVIARRKKNAERSKKYRDRLKLRKTSAIYTSISPEEGLSTSLNGNTNGTSYCDERNCEEANGLLHWKGIQSSVDSETQQLISLRIQSPQATYGEHAVMRGGPVG